jgi:Cd2+/Zn2+-exporting ATPase
VTTLPVSDLAAISGVGVHGEIDGKQYTLGGPQILNDKMRAKFNSAHGIYLLEDDLPVGMMTFSEEIRPEAATTLQSLRKSGYRPIGMLSGDRQEQTDKIAQQLQLDYAHGALTPQEKYERLKESPEPTLMIGDGINDAVALSGAFVSISVARFGADLASQQADITLFGDTISALPKLLRLARRAVATIKINIVVAFAIKLLFLILAVVGYANIWMAVAADMGASLLVIAHSLRLLRE